MEMEIDLLFNLGNVENFDAEPDYVNYLSSIYLRNDNESSSDFREREVVANGSCRAASSVVEGLVEIKIGKENDGFCCIVCLEEFEEGEILKRLPCLHHYHGDCIIPWLRIRATCPLCRYELPTDGEADERRSQGGSAAAGGGGSG
ncbi:E3 ubiquitin-protein ligase RING1-like [Herrania umbratica]|uniref:E3 ubiquitin-protein ligase RING1-like n=1 Tax=Herrania umbratica TaxID=108875 RepID=A0A6J1BBK7_9ROSI|nr:E3 ubiquitin-protein ligase RING1-like [Herrania umbratica]